MRLARRLPGLAGLLLLASGPGLWSQQTRVDGAVRAERRASPVEGVRARLEDNSVASAEDAREAALAEVESEVEAFLRDAAARQWPEVLNHFLPAKIVANREPPLAHPAWIAAGLTGFPADEPSADHCRGPGTLLGAAVVEGWARVRLAGCSRGALRSIGAATAYELWLFHLDGRWRILRVAPLS